MALPLRTDIFLRLPLENTSKECLIMDNIWMDLRGEPSKKKPKFLADRSAKGGGQNPFFRTVLLTWCTRKILLSVSKVFVKKFRGH